jgi:hypothetical protein
MLKKLKLTPCTFVRNTQTGKTFKIWNPNIIEALLHVRKIHAFKNAKNSQNFIFIFTRKSKMPVTLQVTFGTNLLYFIQSLICCRAAFLNFVKSVYPLHWLFTAALGLRMKFHGCLWLRNEISWLSSALERNFTENAHTHTQARMFVLGITFVRTSTNV